MAPTGSTVNGGQRDGSKGGSNGGARGTGDQASHASHTEKQARGPRRGSDEPLVIGDCLETFYGRGVVTGHKTEGETQFVHVRMTTSYHTGKELWFSEDVARKARVGHTPALGQELRGTLPAPTGHEPARGEHSRAGDRAAGQTPGGGEVATR